MRKILSVILVLSFLLFAFAVPTIAEDEPENGAGLQSGNSLKVVQPGGGAYVIIGKLKPGEIEFKYGWNNCAAFEDPAVGYFIGVYNITKGGYVGDVDVPLDECPKMLKLESEELSLLMDHDADPKTPRELCPLPALESGDVYQINFYVRDSYSPATNTTMVEVRFTAP